MFRQPIVTVLGHVDHGKTTLLDYIRNTRVAKKEVGGITQDIGATNLPMNLIFDLASSYLEPIKNKINIPGLLFIDTPGHLAFTSMREKGGAIADLAVLVIDINEGLKPQTLESLDILRKFKTPFVIALTKIDRISGWKNLDKDFIKNYEIQSESTKQEFENKFYTRVSELSELDFNIELFYKIKDFTREIAAVPCSGMTGEGVLNLFVVLIGLSQKFLSEELKVSDKGRGVILEVKKEDKIGSNIDAILYDGTLSVGDRILVEGVEPFEVKVRALLKPASIQDIRVEKKFIGVETIAASSGVKILGKNVELSVAGSNFFVIRDDAEKANLLAEINTSTKSREIEDSKKGIILRAQTLGNLEALLNVFEKFPVRRAKVGLPTKEDLLLLENAPPEEKVLVCFGVQNPLSDMAEEKGIRVIEEGIIYKLYEEFIKWQENLEKELEAQKEARIKKLAKVRFLPDFVFRQSNPAVIGVEVIEGVLRDKTRLMGIDGKILGEVIQMQKEGEVIKTLEKEDRAAVSISGVTVGRNIREGDTMYTFVTREDYRELKGYEKANQDLLEEIRKILNYR
ncbi:MAG: translation initiation factor IF-2 [Candidatus Aenigmarchaeota archaeon]|nr:translation initiation factor IF-2 [Candidatus Aenigmarchaeota archaeon]